MPLTINQSNSLDANSADQSGHPTPANSEKNRSRANVGTKRIGSSVASSLVFPWVCETVNLLLLLSLAMACYSVAWEEATRIYLKGFSDAMVPAAAAPIDKIESILAWMTKGPHREVAALNVNPRDPEETLNYRDLLHVCGTATNAFINIARSTGLPARRLLLLDHNGGVKHVVAEVQVDGRWIIVDPAFRMIPRDASGQPLTRTQLTDPAVFAAATANIPDYDEVLYRYDRTERVRLAKIPLIGPLLRSASSRWPAWSDSLFWTMLLERESFGFMIFSFSLFTFLLLFRFALRWFGEKHLGVHSPRMRARLVRAGVAWFKGGDTQTQN
jgi:hypothetical protein